ncbi:hypothetical protein EZJ49_14870 [Bdellovibrio bacteriovorus]|uniref:hypothetical protein n=1 Tax=Bdellovibrio bacteriovorus TaxID=959 RepID=UPI0021D1F4B8|nr:hypothetical protein [Bdellovibrio bacteriovorus]UXR64349.1 hypothetical protein EZJ49_14870 [Bdellovibrio bacteriovorus]
MNLLKTNQGQGLLESVLILPVLFLLGSILTLLLYRSLVFYVADYHLHEALLCGASEKIHFCEDHFLKQMHQILPSQTDVSIQIQTYRPSGKVVIQLNPTIKISKELALPH